MRHSSGIEVYLEAVDSRKRLEEYPARKVSGEQGPSYCDTYVESTEGQEFALVVELHRNLKIKGANGIEVCVQIDRGEQRHWIYSLPLVKDLPYDILHLTTHTFWVGGVRQQNKLAFSKMIIDKDQFPEEEELGMLEKQIGRIEVKVKIGKKHEVKRNEWSKREVDSVVGGQAPLMLVNAKGISHTVDSSNGRPIQQKNVGEKTLRITKISNAPGPWTFVLKYRPQATLLRLGIKQPVGGTSINELIEVATGTDVALKSEPSQTEKAAPSLKRAMDSQFIEVIQPAAKRIHQATSNDAKEIEMQIRLQLAKARTEQLELELEVHRHSSGISTEVKPAASHIKTETADSDRVQDLYPQETAADGRIVVILDD